MYSHVHDAAESRHPPAFDVAVLRDLPEPARRWLIRAITDRTSLARRADLVMHGEILVGSRWRAFTAAQEIIPGERFVWSARSAADRLAAESVLLPTSLVGATWHAGPDADTAIFDAAHNEAHVLIRIAADGRLLTVEMQRWGNPDGKPFRHHLFRVTFDREMHADGVVVPDGINAAWVTPDGVSRQFFHARLDSVALS